MALLDSTLNLSSLRAPLQNTSPSTTSTLSPLDLPFSSLRKEMALFTQKFDAYLSTSRSSILAARTAHSLRLSQHADSITTTTTQITSLQDSLASQKAVLSAQDTEAKEMAEAVEELRRERDERAARVDELRERLDGVRAKVARGRRERKERGEWEGEMRGVNAVELEEWEGALGLRVEGLAGEQETEAVGEDEKVRFIFGSGAAGGRSKGGEREVSFVLDLSGRTGRAYEVVETKPKVDAKRVEEVVGEMERKEELGRFLSAMRGLLLGR